MTNTSALQPTVIFVGPPSSGKGDRSTDAANNFDAWRWCSGEYFRDKLQAGDDQETMHSGGLVEVDTFKAAVMDAIRSAPRDRLLILDGVAKKRGEAPWLVDFLKENGRYVALVIFLDITREVAQERKRQADRADDAPEVQDRRWDVYLSDTLGESIPYLQDHCPFIRINGDDTPENIQAEIDTAISRCLELAA